MNFIKIKFFNLNYLLKSVNFLLLYAYLFPSSEIMGGVIKISRKNLNRKIFWKIFHLTSLVWVWNVVSRSTEWIQMEFQNNVLRRNGSKNDEETGERTNMMKSFTNSRSPLMLLRWWNPGGGDIRMGTVQNVGHKTCVEEVIWKT
jgi:hypothetical protein